MTEIELLLLDSLKRLSAESAQREMSLTEQLNAVVKRLEVMTENYLILQEQMKSLSMQVKNLSEDIQK